MTHCSANTVFTDSQDFEDVRIQKTKKICPLCEDYANGRLNSKVPITVLSCEGACLKGEVSRQAANIVCFSLLPEKASRICLGAAFTKDSGQRNLVRQSSKVVVLEGCYIECASRMIKGVVPDIDPHIIRVDKLYDCLKDIFGINEVSEDQIKEYAKLAADKIVSELNTYDYRKA